MRAKFLIPAIAASFIALAGCEFDDFGGFERYHEDFHFSYPMKTGARLTVESFNGSVEVSAWDQETVDISGTKYARSQDEARDLKIDITHASDLLHVRSAGPPSGLYRRSSPAAAVLAAHLVAADHQIGRAHV